MVTELPFYQLLPNLANINLGQLHSKLKCKQNLTQGLVPPVCEILDPPLFSTLISSGVHITHYSFAIYGSFNCSCDIPGFLVFCKYKACEFSVDCCENIKLEIATVKNVVMQFGTQ